MVSLIRLSQQDENKLLRVGHKGTSLDCADDLYH